jgi:hypothetical protein
MSSTYHIHADELDENFLASLKALYKGRTLEISVEAEADETERIRSNPYLHAKIEAALRNDNSENLVPLDMTTLEAFEEFIESGGAAAPHLS